MKSLSLKVPEALARKISRYARGHGTTLSDVIRRAVEQLISADDADTGDISAYDLVEPFAGCVEGPRDLSTNPGHMTGYGR